MKVAGNEGGAPLHAYRSSRSTCSYNVYYVLEHVYLLSKHIRPRGLPAIGHIAKTIAKSRPIIQGRIQDF